MDLGPTILLVLFLVFNFTFVSLDVQRNKDNQQTLWAATKAANQNALYEIQDKYDHYEEINSLEMLENWMINFCNNNSLNVDEIKVSFVQIETDPVPLFLAYIEGQNDAYIFIKDQDIITKYYNGALLIEKE